jgi:hypothetical protein
MTQENNKEPLSKTSILVARLKMKTGHHIHNNKAHTRTNQVEKMNSPYASEQSPN